MTPLELGTFDFAVYTLIGDPRRANDGAEGGFVNDARDDGGPTKYGLTQPFYDEFRHRIGLPAEHVRHATEEDARNAYYRLIWIDRQLRVEDVSRTAPRVGLVYFDGCVNHGTLMARMLQAELRSGLRVDGVIGPITLRALVRRSVEIGEPAIACQLLERRRRLYERHPDFPAFGRGWRNRLTDLARFADLPWHWTP